MPSIRGVAFVLRNGRRPAVQVGRTARGDLIVRPRRVLSEVLLRDEKPPECVQIIIDPPHHIHRAVYDHMTDLELNLHRREIEQRRFVRALDRMMEEGSTRVTVQRIAELRGMPASGIPAHLDTRGIPIDDDGTAAIIDVLQHWSSFP